MFRQGQLRIRTEQSTLISKNPKSVEKSKNNFIIILTSSKVADKTFHYYFIQHVWLYNMYIINFCLLIFKYIGTNYKVSQRLLSRSINVSKHFTTVAEVFYNVNYVIVNYSVKNSTVDCKYLLFLQDFFFRLKPKQYKKYQYS